jgi:hypothetical protein
MADDRDEMVEAVRCQLQLLLDTLDAVRDSAASGQRERELVRANEELADALRNLRPVVRAAIDWRCCAAGQEAADDRTCATHYPAEGALADAVDALTDEPETCATCTESEQGAQGHGCQTCSLAYKSNYKPRKEG